MNNSKKDVRGPAMVARQLQSWLPTDSPDIINATTRYIAEEWLRNRKASSTAVYSVYAMARDLGATGDVEAAVIACALERLLEQNGCLELNFTIGLDSERRRRDHVGRTRH